MAEMPETTPRRYYQGNGTRYEQAQQHIDETTENIFTERKWWRYGCFAGLGVIGVLAILIVSLARRPAYEPVFITHNMEGQFQVVRWDAYKPEVEEVKTELFRWLRCVRGVPTDAAIVEYCWKMVPLFLLEKTQALVYIKTFYQTLKPKELLFHKKIEVVDLKGRREPDGRWRLEWTEDVYGFREKQGLGRKESSERLSAVISIKRRKPTSRKEIELAGEIVNPLGIYIDTLGWGN